MLGLQGEAWARWKMKSLARSLLTVILMSVMTISLEIPLDNKVSEDYQESSGDKAFKENSEEDVTDFEDYEYKDYDDEYDDYYDEDYEYEDNSDSDYHDDEKEE